MLSFFLLHYTSPAAVWTVHVIKHLQKAIIYAVEVWQQITVTHAPYVQGEGL